MDIEIKENERIDDLQYKGLKLIQNIDGFCFGVDAVLLANFADIKKNENVLDLGTGTGIIPILIAGKTNAKQIIGLEIQTCMAEMANRSVCLNKVDDRVRIVEGDIKECTKYFEKGSFDVVVSNPPYMNSGGGIINSSDMKAVSRHEILCSLEDVVRGASQLLKPGGQFVIVHRPSRLVDIMCSFRQNNIEPKYIRFVHPSPYKKPNLILIKGTKYGKPELKILDPLYVYDGNGKYTKEIEDIYNRDKRGEKNE